MSPRDCRGTMRLENPEEGFISGPQFRAAGLGVRPRPASQCVLLRAPTRLRPAVYQSCALGAAARPALFQLLRNRTERKLGAPFMEEREN